MSHSRFFLKRLHASPSIYLIAFVVGCASSPQPLSSPHPVPTTRSIEVQGHRGARSIYPENTIPAFEYALRLGVDTLELDLLVTKDDVLVVHHDFTINPVLCEYKTGRPAPPNRAVRSLSLMELKAFDCGNRPHPRFPQQNRVPQTEIPSFKEFLEWLVKHSHPQAKIVHLNVETKSDAIRTDLQPEPKEFVVLVLGLLRQYGVLDRTTLQSFDHRTLVEAKRLAPTIKTSALFEKRPAQGLLAEAQKLGVEVVSPHHQWLTPSEVRQIQAAGIQVIPWTANTPEEWDRLLHMGVDGIITDDPEPLLKKLGRTGKAEGEKTSLWDLRPESERCER